MGLLYDNDVFAKHAANAVKSADEIKVGDILYSNTYPREFTVYRILTDAKHKQDVGLNDGKQDNDEPRWVQYDQHDAWRSQSLKDMNIGAHYNPWLLFKNRADRDACERELKIEYVKDDYDDLFDDVWACDYDYDSYHEKTT